MKSLVILLFVTFISSTTTLLERIKADQDYLTYLDAQNKIKDGLRNKRFVLPNNFVQLSRSDLNSSDINVWNTVLKREGMLNAEEYVKLHFLQWNSLIKVTTKFKLEIDKLNRDDQMKLFAELIKV